MSSRSTNVRSVAETIRRRFSAGRLMLALPALLALAAAPETPAPGPLHIIGGQAAGCIAGAVRLPADGSGFQTIHLARSSFWGAPSTIAQIERLGEQAHAAGFGDLYVEDISRPRGGPLPGGHVSHQLGIDVDVGLESGRSHCWMRLGARPWNCPAWCVSTSAASIQRIGRPM